MKILFTFLIITVNIVFTFSQTGNCYQSLRKGKFVYVENPGVIIKRTGNTQTETYNNGKSKLIMTIRWVSDTEYLLIFKKAIQAPTAMMKKGDILDVKILSCNQGEYTYKFRSIRNGEVLMDDIPGSAIKKVE